MKKIACTLSVVVFVGVAIGQLTGRADDPAPNKPQHLEVDGLHNVFRISEKLFSGNSPEGDASFESLKKLGIKTIISVDGATPDLERAKKFGMRYVHIPIDYDGVPVDAGQKIAKAVSELPAPIDMHCHHGKHRGPSAAAIAQLCLDDKCTVETALDLLKAAGTDPKYKGLYASVQAFKKPTAEELAKLPKELPETVKPEDIVKAMVAIDFHYDNLKSVRAAGWQTPKDHADIEPAHEPLPQWERYVELERLPDTAKRPEDFRKWVGEAVAGAKDFEQAWRDAKTSGAIDRELLEKYYKRRCAFCTQC
jgi:protein tyrosine phosphatase (PTP) superfamily phosphohydrolase (DUF442 family)